MFTRSDFDHAGSISYSVRCGAVRETSRDGLSYSSATKQTAGWRAGGLGPLRGSMLPAQSTQRWEVVSRVLCMGELRLTKNRPETREGCRGEGGVPSSSAAAPKKA